MAISQLRKATNATTGLGAIRRGIVMWLALSFAALAMSAPSALAAGVNGRIAFSSDRSGVFAIWTINPDGTGATQLTNHGTNIQDWWPVVSPDGRRIAFTRYTGTKRLSTGSYNEAIYVMNADGSNLQRLTGNSVDNNLADFSPDGSKIAFISDRSDPNPSTDCRQGAGIGAPGCNWEIYVMNADGTNQQQLTNAPPAAETYPEFSPDGTKIMFSSTRSGFSAVYTMNRDGSDVQKLTPDSTQAGDSNWSPDGSKITFVNNFCPCSGNSDVYTMSADGASLTQLTNNFDNNLEPGYSPDGSEITFSHFVTFPNGDVFVMKSADGSGKTNLTNTAPTHDSETPDWGPVR